MENKLIGFQERVGYRGASDVLVYQKFALDPRAILAIELVKHFGVVAAAPNGEDTAGRQKIEMQNVDDLADRACDIAAALFSRFEQREWTIELPNPKMEKEAI